MAIKVANNNQALSFKVAAPQPPEVINGLVYKGTLSSADDLNDMYGAAYTGWYDFTSKPQHAPENANTYGTFMMIGMSNGFMMQMYVHPGDNGYFGYETIAIRHRTGSPLTWRDWYSVKDMWASLSNTAIAEDTDLNTITAPGVYRGTVAIAQSLTHSPYTEGIWPGNTGFRLETITITSANYFVQRIYTLDAEPRLFIRTCTNGTFQSWTEIHKNNIIRVNYKTETIAAATGTSLAIDSSEVLKGFNPLTNATANNRYITVPAGTYRFSYQINTNPGSNGHARAWLSWSNTSSTPSTTASYAVSVASGGYANNNFLGLNGTGVLKFTEASRVALVFLPYNNSADVSGPGTKPYMIIERL